MKKSFYSILGLLLTAFLSSCGGDDVSKYTEEEYSEADKVAFEKRRDSTFLSEYPVQMKKIAEMYCENVSYDEWLKAYDEVKAELDSKTGTFYSMDVKFTRSIEDEAFKQFIENDESYFVVFTRKTMAGLVSQEILDKNKMHVVVSNFNEMSSVNETLTNSIINDPVLPILQNATPDEKSLESLRLVYGTPYIFVLSQLNNTVPTSTSAGNYYGMVTVVNTYENKIIANYPIAFLYQELSNLEGDLQTNLRMYSKKALNINLQ